MSIIRSGDNKLGRSEQELSGQRRAVKVHVDPLGRRYVIPSEFIQSDEAQKSLRQIRDFRREQAQRG